MLLLSQIVYYAQNEVVPGSEIQVATGAGSGGVGPSLNNRTATNYLTGQKPDRSPEQMQVFLLQYHYNFLNMLFSNLY